MTTKFDYTDLRCHALALLTVSEPGDKAQGVRVLAEAWRVGTLALDVVTALPPQAGIPGRPARPELVLPREVKRRSLQTVEGRAVLIHALAHIEFNAINLALDAIWRFPNMPNAFYSDWLQVADEEALHFSLLSDHLRSLGFVYGDFPAHNGLWDMADRTRDDVLARMALIPRTMEARGLDVTPGLRARLAQAGDHAAAKILDIVLRDEIGHVAIGNHWYGWLCAQRGLEPVHTYQRLVEDYRVQVLRGPVNLEARRQAGFSPLELAALVEPGPG